MRGRRLGASSSSGRSVHQETSRKRAFRDVSSKNQQTSDDTQDNNEDELQKLLPTKRRKERENQSQAGGMSEKEEEEMKLALRLSEQEAGLSALRLQQEEEEEEEAVMRAIHQSMVGDTEACPGKPLPSLSAGSSTRWSRRRACPDDRGSGAENRKCVKKRRVRGGSPAPQSQQSSDSTHIEDSPLHRSPVFPPTGRTAEVHVDRLNQDALQTCSPPGSALFSQDSWTSTQTPERSQRRAPNSPVFTREDAQSLVHQTKASPVCFLSSSPDSVTPSVASISPVFPGSPSHPHPHDKSNQSDRPHNMKHKRPSEEELSDMTLVLSDHDEDDVTPVASPSPVFPQEVPMATCKETDSLSRLRSSHGERVQTVRYHWGVPFCPRGEEPDAYTQVIVDQLEFYEKSLKQAQRFLLRKAEWGEPVLPRSESSSSPEQTSESPPVCGRWRNRTQQEEDKNEEGEEAEVEKEEVEVEEKCDVDQIQTDECQVCPETPQSDVQEEEEEEQHATKDDRRSADSPDHDHTPPADEQKQQEVEEKEEEKEVMEEENASQVRGQGREAVRDDDDQCCSSPELQDASTVALVDCPLCQRSFSVHEVERHAAYCDGQEDGVHRAPPPNNTVKVNPRRMRTRRAEVSAEGAHGSRKLECCYVCQQNFPLKDYSAHVERCIQRHSSSSRPTAERNLLSALDETEKTGGAASGSKAPVRDVIDLLSDDDDDDDEGEVMSGFRVSDSPIRSFTPISEASDCLIDFTHHKPSKMSRRRR
ncbi:BRCA1-A complex subunit RAP80 isoform X2 [Gouania willdenowi]|uniref:BRCA1-A complex subunit RAP80 isoform X2 n=1 Tax=Gouania willdenowi TaxID=441366 RepID=UPI0010568EC9|nr:BRCA1-A complex subunit RAP80 isoform X2 [Gouania willdenowi]